MTLSCSTQNLILSYLILFSLIVALELIHSRCISQLNNLHRPGLELRTSGLRNPDRTLTTQLLGHLISWLRFSWDPFLSGISYLNKHPKPIYMPVLWSMVCLLTSVYTEKNMWQNIMIDIIYLSITLSDIRNVVNTDQSQSFWQFLLHNWQWCGNYKQFLYWHDIPLQSLTIHVEHW
jgi:hypothetical protein